MHAYKETRATRQRLLKKISEVDCQVVAIVLDKSRVYTKLRDEKIVLYNYITNILLDRLFTRKPIPLTDEITLIASRRETNKFLNKNFKEYLSREIHNNHRLSLKIKLATPHEEKSLQVADFVSWAIFRKYELRDDSYYGLIKSRILEESPLFA